MRPWMIVIGSATGALTGDILWTRPEFLTAPQLLLAANSDTAAALILPGLALYGGLATLLVTASITLDLYRTRLRIARLRPPTRSAWIGCFQGTGLIPLVGRLLDVAPDYDDEIILQSPLNASAIRQEVQNHYRDWLTRTHAFTAFMLLLLIAFQGWAQGYANASAAGIRFSLIETISAIAVLITLWGASRIVVTSIAESFLDAITRLPSKRLDILLLQSRIIQLEKNQVHAAPECPMVHSDALQSLGSTLKEVTELLHETASRLWMTSQTVAEVAQVTSHRTMDPSAIEELSVAIQQLAATVSQGPNKDTPTPSRDDHKELDTTLSSKFRDLLNNFD